MSSATPVPPPDALPPPWRRWRDFLSLTRMDRPIGILLLGWSMLWALWIGAGGWPGWRLFLIFVLGTVLTRAAGCCINDFADRTFDGQVKRTDGRPLATGAVRPAEALILAAVLMLLAFALVLMTNALTIQLSVLALALAIVYPFCKRVTHWPQAVLGAAFGMAVPMAFAATRGEVPAIGWCLFVVALLWSLAYDTMYAMVDRDDDLKLGLRSTAILFGEADVGVTMVLQGVVLAGLAAVGVAAGLGGWFALGLLAALGTVLWQHALIRERRRAPSFRAFLNNHFTGMAVFAGIALDTALR